VNQALKMLKALIPDIMKKNIFLPLVLLFGTLTNNIWSQTDSLKINKLSPAIYYLGFGFGPNTRGGNFELSFTFTTSGYWGGSLNLRNGYVKLANVPADYGGQFGRLPPFDSFMILSFDLVKKFPTAGKSVRFGFEAGPSYVKYNLTKLVIDPNYGFPGVYKYDKVHTPKNALGVSLTAKTEFPFSRFIGCELGLFTIINKVQSVLGLNVCLTLGKVRK
jgi:hypothetical protein